MSRPRKRSVDVYKRQEHSRADDTGEDELFGRNAVAEEAGEQLTDAVDDEKHRTDQTGL